MDERVRAEREKLESLGFIKDFTFVKDYPFGSPTKAACFIVGTRVQGCKCWNPQEAVNEPATSEQAESGIADTMEASPPNGMLGNMLKMLSFTHTSGL
jgi:hypothetical protein